MKSNQTFTEQQLANFREYEIVRESGFFNMFSKDAVASTGLTEAEYTFVMLNYAALQEADKESK